MSDLVSIIIPTYHRAELLLARSLPSALNQTHADLDIHVVGDGADQATVDAMATVTDPRVRFTNIERQVYPDDPIWAWNVRGSQAINYGLDHAVGDWISTLGDDDELTPDSIEVLLAAAYDKEVDLIYGRSEIVGSGFLGDGNPRHAGQTNHSVWRPDDTRMDLECYADRRLPNDWDFFQRYIAKHRWGFIPVVVHRYYPATSIPWASPT